MRAARPCRCVLSHGIGVESLRFSIRGAPSPRSQRRAFTPHPDTPIRGAWTVSRPAMGKFDRPKRDVMARALNAPRRRSWRRKQPAPASPVLPARRTPRPKAGDSRDRISQRNIVNAKRRPRVSLTAGPACEDWESFLATGSATSSAMAGDSLSRSSGAVVLAGHVSFRPFVWRCLSLGQPRNLRCSSALCRGSPQF